MLAELKHLSVSLISGVDATIFAEYGQLSWWRVYNPFSHPSADELVRCIEEHWDGRLMRVSPGYLNSDIILWAAQNGHIRQAQIMLDLRPSIDDEHISDLLMFGLRVHPPRINKKNLFILYGLVAIQLYLH